MAEVNKKNYSIIDYAKSYFASIEISPFNELDFAILSKFSYFNFDVYFKAFNKKKFYIKDLYDLRYIDKFLGSNSKVKDEVDLFMYVVGNPRFKNMEIIDYKEKVNKVKTEQFGVVAFKIGKYKIISFRGTPLNYYGWKEDFDMAYRFPIPSQITALNYLKNFLKGNKDTVYLTGHSKGGNLAIYSYMNLSKAMQSKVKQIITFDSPGFENISFETLKKRKIINKFIPSHSVIGMIFDDEKDVSVIKTNVIFTKQHEMFFWEVDLSKLKFVQDNGLNPRFKKFNSTFKEYLKDKSMEDRKFAINLLFKLIKVSSIDKNGDINFDIKSSLKIIRTEYKKESPKTKEKMNTIIKEIINVLIKGIV